MVLIKKYKEVIIIALLLIVVAVFGIVADYNLYMLSLNGKVQNIRTNIKEVMYITVNNKEYDIEHHWPALQKNVAIGDSVYKAPKDTVVVLVKAKTGEKFFCNYSDVLK